MAASTWIPWRSVWLPRAVTAAALVVGLPLFLRSPPWCDITLYQMAARNLLSGGVHYRDIFDTNLPGFVWALTAIQWVFGTSTVAVRVADLLIVLGVVLLIDRLARWGGATPAGRWWALAGAALVYLFAWEVAHAQRDVWMALPALAAVVLRVRRGIGDARPTPPTPLPSGGGEKDNGSADSPSLQGGGWGVGSSSAFRRSALEGVLWGAAVWVKPHVALMAAAVWLLTARRLSGAHPQSRAGWGRAAGADLAGNLLGGLAVGLAGVGWLVASGAWPAFLDVFTNWNPGYLQLARQEFDERSDQALHWFPPWSLGLVLTVPLALASVLDMAPWSGRRDAGPDRGGFVGRRLPGWLWDRRAGPDARFVRGVLAGLYLAWAAQAFFVQRAFLYAHVPETLLMLGLWATHRWSWAALAALWLAAAGGLWLAADGNSGVRDELGSLPPEARERYVPRHPITDTRRLRLWPRCWRPDLTPQERYALWDELRGHPIHEASVSWQEIAEVAEFLRAQGVGDGEVVAWFDSPHAVYVLLDTAPGIRFMHVHTVGSIGPDGRGETGHTKVMRELAAATRARFVIGDLQWVAQVQAGEPQHALFGPPRRPPHDLLPASCPYRHLFPFNQPTVFRTRNGQGRYVVHRVVTRWDDPPAVLAIPAAAAGVVQPLVAPCAPPLLGRQRVGSVERFTSAEFLTGAEYLTGAE